MMRGLAFLALISAGSANSEHKEGYCTLESVTATANVVDAVLNIWAATKRCNSTKYDTQFGYKSDVEIAPVFCEIDITASIKSLADLAGSVAGMASECGLIGKGTGAACGESAGKLISVTAGLAKAGGKIDEWCGATDKYPWTAYHNGKAVYQRSDPFEQMSTIGKCSFNAGKSVTQLNSIYASVKDIEKKCKGGGKWCAVSVMGVMRSVSGFGAYLANAAAQCYMVDVDEKAAKADTTADYDQEFLRPTNCAGAISVAIAYINGLGALGIMMEDQCKPPKDSRLYLDTGSDNSETATSLPTVLALAAAIPLAAVLSFIAGSKLSKKSRTTRQIMAVSEEAELLNVEE